MQAQDAEAKFLRTHLRAFEETSSGPQPKGSMWALGDHLAKKLSEATLASEAI